MNDSRPGLLAASRLLLRGRSGRSARERGLAGSGFLRAGFVGELVQDAFVEGGDGVEFGGGEQVDEVLADVVRRARVLRLR